MTRNLLTDGNPFSVALLNALINGAAGEGVQEGLGLSTGAGSFEVDYAAGVYEVGSEELHPTSGSVTHSTSDTNDRIDLITGDTSGTISVTEGSPDSGGEGDPIAPGIPNNEVLIGLVYVRGGSSEIKAGDLYDYRILLRGRDRLEDIYQLALPQLNTQGYHGGLYPAVAAMTDHRDGSTVSGQGTVIETIQTPATALRGVAVDPSDGSLWVVDSSNDEIIHQTRTGTEISSFAAPESAPTRVAVDPADGTIWHCEATNGNVFQFDREGNQLAKFTTSFNEARGIGVDPARGEILVVNNENDQIQRFDRDGTTEFNFSIATPTAGAGGVAVSPEDGTVWFKDDDEVFQYTRGGTELQKFGTDPLFWGIDIDPVDGSLWIADTANDEIEHVSQYSDVDTIAVDGATLAIEDRISDPHQPIHRADHVEFDPINTVTALERAQEGWMAFESGASTNPQGPVYYNPDTNVFNAMVASGPQDLGSTSGAHDGQPALSDGTTATELALYHWDDDNSRWVRADGDNTITP